MKYSSIPLSLFLLFIFVASSAAADPLLMVRPIDAPAANTLARALERSALVRALVSELEASNVVVHILFSRDLPLGIAGTTRFVTSKGGYRYLRITIATVLRDYDRVPILGHELQHAAEIARSNAADPESIRKVLESDGYQTREQFFETRSALRVEKRVREELLALEAEPVIELHHQHLRARSTKPTAEVPKR